MKRGLNLDAYGPRGASGVTGITRNSTRPLGPRPKGMLLKPKGGFVNQAGLLEKNLRLAGILAADGIDVEEVLRMATIDTVTGIYNLYEIERRAVRSLEQSKRIAMVVVDLDGLKGVNDTYGHLEGDRYLQSFVDFCHKSLRSSDQIGRTGGDEFLIVMPETTAAQAENIMSRLQESADQLNIRFSYGISDATTEPNTSLMELINLADRLMYEQKRRRKQPN